MFVELRRKVVTTLALFLNIITIEKVVNSEVVARMGLLPQDQTPS